MSDHEMFRVSPNYDAGAVWIQLGNLPRKLIPPEEARRVADEIEDEMDGQTFGPEFDDPQDIADGLREAADEVDDA